MSNRRIKLQGRKVQKQRKLKELERKADNLVMNITDYIDPFEEWLDLKVEESQQAMNDLYEVVRNGRQIKNDIEQLKKELGEQ